MNAAQEGNKANAKQTHVTTTTMRTDVIVFRGRSMSGWGGDLIYLLLVLCHCCANCMTKSRNRALYPEACGTKSIYLGIQYLIICRSKEFQDL